MLRTIISSWSDAPLATLCIFSRMQTAFSRISRGFTPALAIAAIKMDDALCPQHLYYSNQCTLNSAKGKRTAWIATVARLTHSLPFKGRAGVGMGATSLAIVHSTRFAAATEEGIANRPRRSKRRLRAGGIWGGVLYARD